MRTRVSKSYSEVSINTILLTVLYCTVPLVEEVRTKRKRVPNLHRDKKNAGKNWGEMEDLKLPQSGWQRCNVYVGLVTWHVDAPPSIVSEILLRLLETKRLKKCVRGNRFLSVSVIDVMCVCR